MRAIPIPGGCTPNLMFVLTKHLSNSWNPMKFRTTKTSEAYGKGLRHSGLTHSPDPVTDHETQSLIQSNPTGGHMSEQKPKRPRWGVYSAAVPHCQCGWTGWLHTSGRGVTGRRIPNCRLTARNVPKATLRAQPPVCPRPIRRGSMVVKPRADGGRKRQ